MTIWIDWEKAKVKILILFEVSGEIKITLEISIDFGSFYISDCNTFTTNFKEFNFEDNYKIPDILEDLLKEIDFNPLKSINLESYYSKVDDLNLGISLLDDIEKICNPFVLDN